MRLSKSARKIRAEIEQRVRRETQRKVSALKNEVKKLKEDERDLMAEIGTFREQLSKADKIRSDAEKARDELQSQLNRECERNRNLEHELERVRDRERDGHREYDRGRRRSRFRERRRSRSRDRSRSQDRHGISPATAP